MGEDPSTLYTDTDVLPANKGASTCVQELDETVTTLTTQDEIAN
jgi:hypothetical protein